MTDAYAELEIGLFPAGTGGEAPAYALDFRFWLPGSDAEARLLGNQVVTAALPAAQFLALSMDPAAYGASLTRSLFADPRALVAFAKARAAAQGRGIPLRLRLLFAPGAAALHGLAWETILDPEDNQPLALKEDILLSRVLASQDARPVQLAPRGDLRAVFMAASPVDLDRLGLPAIDVDGEAGRVRDALEGGGSGGTAQGGIHLDALSGPGCPPGSLDRLLDALRGSRDAPAPDILYLVCHGGQVAGTYWLVLEDAQGKADRVPGDVFLQALEGLARPPRLVVLSACQSARVGGSLRDPAADGAFAARLAEAGIPAVLAMQADFSMDTGAAFLPVFFRELARDGQIDRAAAAARIAVRARPDFWVPALFTCLRSGKIWQDAEPAAGAKFNVTVKDAKGVVIGDHNTVTQNFD